MYTSTVQYTPVDQSIFSGVRQFPAVGFNTKTEKASPESSVYRRAKEEFNHTEYKYPAPPLNLGYRGILINEEVYVLRLLIKAPGTDFFLPEGLLFLQPMILDTLDYQRDNFPDFDNRFVYVTVRAGIVKSNRDDDFHVDGFQGISVPRHIPEQNYIWMRSRTNDRSDNYATLVSMQPYFIEGLDPAVHNAHTFFNEHTDRNAVFSLKEKTLYVIDPYHVHARPVVPEGTFREFVRVTYSPVEIRDDTNTVNPFLPRGPFNRSDIRNTLVPYEVDELADNGLVRK